MVSGKLDNVVIDFPLPCIIMHACRPEHDPLHFNIGVSVRFVSLFFCYRLHIFLFSIIIKKVHLLLFSKK